MKTSIAGPMTWLPDFNRAAFFAAAAKIAASGDILLNTVALAGGPGDADFSREAAMWRCNLSA